MQFHSRLSSSSPWIQTSSTSQSSKKLKLFNGRNPTIMTMLAFISFCITINSAYATSDVAATLSILETTIGKREKPMTVMPTSGDANFDASFLDSTSLHAAIEKHNIENTQRALRTANSHNGFIDYMGENVERTFKLKPQLRRLSGSNDGAAKFKILRQLQTTPETFSSELCTCSPTVFHIRLQLSNTCEVDDLRDNKGIKGTLCLLGEAGTGGGKPPSSRPSTSANPTSSATLFPSPSDLITTPPKQSQPPTTSASPTSSATLFPSPPSVIDTPKTPSNMPTLSQNVPPPTPINVTLTPTVDPFRPPAGVPPVSDGSQTAMPVFPTFNPTTTLMPTTSFPSYTNTGSDGEGGPLPSSMSSSIPQGLDTDAIARDKQEGSDNENGFSLTSSPTDAVRTYAPTTNFPTAVYPTLSPTSHGEAESATDNPIGGIIGARSHVGKAYDNQSGVRSSPSVLKKFFGFVDTHPTPVLEAATEAGTVLPMTSTSTTYAPTTYAPTTYAPTTPSPTYSQKMSVAESHKNYRKNKSVKDDDHHRNGRRILEVINMDELENVDARTEKEGRNQKDMNKTFQSQHQQFDIEPHTPDSWTSISPNDDFFKRHPEWKVQQEEAYRLRNNDLSVTRNPLLKTAQSQTRHLQQASTFQTTPTLIISAQFLELDTSPDMNIINQDDQYLNLTFPSAEEDILLSFTSVSTMLDPALPIEDQLEYVPGGVILVLVGMTDSGEIVRNRLMWTYTNGCGYREKTVMVGDEFGWSTFKNLGPAREEFCPASGVVTTPPTSSPTPVDQLSTVSPTLSTTKPTNKPTREPSPDFSMNYSADTTMKMIFDNMDLISSNEGELATKIGKSPKRKDNGRRTNQLETTRGKMIFERKLSPRKEREKRIIVESEEEEETKIKENMVEFGRPLRKQLRKRKSS